VIGTAVENPIGNGRRSFAEDSAAMSAEQNEFVTPVRPIQVRLARLGILGAIVLFICVHLAGNCTF
jgi:hypothetical protein